MDKINNKMPKRIKKQRKIKITSGEEVEDAGIFTIICNINNI